jgi:hypothetical protein
MKDGGWGFFLGFLFMKYLKMVGANKVWGLCNTHIVDNFKCKLKIIWFQFQLLFQGGQLREQMKPLKTFK